jgi:hypothetical protein
MMSERSGRIPRIRLLEYNPDLSEGMDADGSGE